MNKLILKPEFQGLIISKQTPGVGTITLDTNTCPSEHYSNFLPYGFEGCFTVVQDTVVEHVAVFTEEQVEKVKDEFIKANDTISDAVKEAVEEVIETIKVEPTTKREDGSKPTYNFQKKKNTTKTKENGK